MLRMLFHPKKFALGVAHAIFQEFRKRYQLRVTTNCTEKGLEWTIEVVDRLQGQPTPFDDLED